ncbi:hypothetical protein ABW19_dt0206582 [Dactylella cylindrospora]|nr:hypothetical protein ABW19_dt0206582 [Dactylella cylindrospora]
MWAYFRANLEPILTFFSFRPIPWALRWRMLAFLPGFTLINSMKYLPWVFSSAYKTVYIPSSHGAHKIRAIVFEPKYSPSKPSPTKPRPLHFTVHGGAFLAGLAEHNADLADTICKETGAVVVSVQYRGGPRYPFPAAHDDVDDALTYFITKGVEIYNLDVNNVTVSGLSAGGNLALSACEAHPGKIAAGAVAYAAVDVRLAPWEKPIPPNFPTKDPLSWLLPLFHAYAGLNSEKYKSDERLHPILAPVEKLPRDMLFVIPCVDILLHEQTVFVERLKKETEGTGRKVESVFYEKDIHGWIELPASVRNQETAEDALRRMVAFLKESNEKGGWKW